MGLNTRTQNASKTFVFGIVEKIIAIAFPFLIRTLIIYRLGNEYLGLNGLFTSILNLLSLTELGFSSAIAFCLYKPIAFNEKEKIGALSKLLCKLYKIVGVVITILGLVVAPFLRYLINGAIPAGINIYVLYLLYLLNTIAPYFLFSYRAVIFDAYQEGRINHLISSVCEIVKYVFQIIVLLFFVNYYIYLLFLPLSTISISIASEICFRKKHPEIKQIGEVSKNDKKFIRKKIGVLFAHSVTAKLTSSADNIVISTFLGLSSVAIFDNYQYIYTAVLGFLIIGYRALKPVLANSYYRDTTEQCSKIYKSMRFLSYWASCWCSICLLCLFQPFMRLWVGENNMLSFLCVVAISAYFYSNCVRQFFANTYIDILGLWNKTLVRQIVASVINLILNLVFVNYFGVFGIIIASFITNAFIALPMDIYVVNKAIALEDSKKAFGSLLTNFMIALVLSFSTYLMCNFSLANTIVELFIKLIICFVFPNVIWIILNSNSDYYYFLKKHLFSIIKGQGKTNE